MKITIPETWGCNNSAADDHIYKRAYYFVNHWNRKVDLEEKLEAVVSFFGQYENIYSLHFAKYAMKVEVAYNVMHFACDIAATSGITEDVILGLWKQIFRRDIWEFTGRYSPFSARQVLLAKT